VKPGGTQWKQQAPPRGRPCKRNSCRGSCGKPGESPLGTLWTRRLGSSNRQSAGQRLHGFGPRGRGFESFPGYTRSGMSKFQRRFSWG